MEQSIELTFVEEDMIRPLCPQGLESWIYRAEVPESGRFGKMNRVVVKRFRTSLSKIEAEQILSSDLLMRWDHLKKLKHENLISYHTWNIAFSYDWRHAESYTGPRFFDLDFVMEYSDGSDLRSMMYDMAQSDRKLHVKALFDFSKQMANGLSYLHKNNIIHGDLNSNSVLVSKASTNNFRLRLGGLDSFTSSYEAFIKRRWFREDCVAPEMLEIIREGASFVLDDPVYKAFRLIQKSYAIRTVAHKDKYIEKDLIEDTIDSYGTWTEDRLGEEMIQSRKNFSALFFGLLPPPGDDGLSLPHILQELCLMDSARVEEFCTQLENDMDYSGVPSTYFYTLDTVMSMLFRHIRAPTTASQDTNFLACLESKLLSVSIESVRADWRKADIWSIGSIMRDLARKTFRKGLSEKEQESALSFLGSSFADHCNWHNFFEERMADDHSIFYALNFIPKDFEKLLISCRDRSADQRPTVEELINKLVALEEHTYGSTWVSKQNDGVAEEELSDDHREMLEEIGCTCTYDYCFWRDFLGQGAYGHVYKAKVTEAGTYKGRKTVAVKEVTFDQMRTRHMKKDNSWGRAKEQWQSLVGLRHPHLVTYHKVTLRKLINGAGIEFMMDYCEGGDLDMLISQCKTGICSLPSEGVANYATQLALGLCFLHEYQFIHGDLKPGNVFMDRATGQTGNRTLRIGDLDGAVRIRNDFTKTERKDLAGTGPYMSPEMVRLTFEQEHEDIGLATDIWSFGCVILDLANCSAGIKERLFQKTVTNVKGTLETHKIERQQFSANAFLFQLSQGFHPYISEQIHPDMRNVIQSCLQSACVDRTTAALVLAQLLCDANGDPR